MKKYRLPINCRTTQRDGNRNFNSSIITKHRLFHADVMRFISKLGHVVLVAHTRATIPEPFANECWVYLRLWDRTTTSCVAYERSRRRKRLLIVRRGPRMGVCVCATAQDEGTVVAPMRLQSKANWTNKRLAASYCWRYRLRYWWRLHHPDL